MQNVIQLKDLKFKPDSFHTYTSALKNQLTPLIIDNGSFQCRVGWATSTDPLLQFRNLIAKPRKDRNKKDGEIPVTPPIQIGNDIVNIEAMRFQLKTQFDRNVVTHYYNQEQIFDYAFSHLSIDSDSSVPHPILLTECFSNPNYCRQLMSELLFECYNVPSVCYGVDSLFSYYNNSELQSNGLIIGFGYHTTHIIPILDGKVIAHKSRRLSVGGYHMINYLHRLLQLKYPVHVNGITISRVEEILVEHCHVALDYMKELQEWSDYEYYENHILRIQLPYSQTASTTLMSVEQRNEKKKEVAKRLSEMNARKREERLQEDETLIQKLYACQDLYEEGDMKQFRFAIKQCQISSYEDLEKMVTNVKQRIERTKGKISAAADTNSGQEEKSITIPQPPENISLESWVDEVKRKRKIILENKHARKQRKTDMARRRTAAAQERMRIISQLARKEKGTDDFGLRDEDWDIYKTINRECGDSDSDLENDKLLEFEEVLRHHDPTFDEPQVSQGGAAEYHQLHVGVEAIRTPELLFQPSMMGSAEAGLIESIEQVLRSFTADEQLLLANNIFLTGGCAQFPGLKERISKEMLAIRPYETTHKIVIAKVPVLDGWNGARKFANSSEFKTASISKTDYNEFGGEYFIEHKCSNYYFPTPAAIVVEPTD